MDLVIVDVFARMLSESRCTSDDVLETPELRQAFLSNVRHALGPVPERDLLHRLTYLRKKKMLPRLRG